MTIFDFISKYCSLYDLEEDDFTTDDVLFLEDVFFNYTTNGDIPEFMRVN